MAGAGARGLETGERETHHGAPQGAPSSTGPFRGGHKLAEQAFERPTPAIEDLGEVIDERHKFEETGAQETYHLPDCLMLLAEIFPMPDGLMVKHPVSEDADSVEPTKEVTPHLLLRLCLRKTRPQVPWPEDLLVAAEKQASPEAEVEFRDQMIRIGQFSVLFKPNDGLRHRFGLFGLKKSGREPAGSKARGNTGIHAISESYLHHMKGRVEGTAKSQVPRIARDDGQFVILARARKRPEPRFRKGLAQRSKVGGLHPLHVGTILTA